MLWIQGYNLAQSALALSLPTHFIPLVRRSWINVPAGFLANQAMCEVSIFMCQLLNCYVGTVGGGMHAFQGQMAFQPLKMAVSYHRRTGGIVYIRVPWWHSHHMVTEMAPEREGCDSLMITWLLLVRRSSLHRNTFTRILWYSNRHCTLLTETRYSYSCVLVDVHWQGARAESCLGP